MMYANFDAAGRLVLAEDADAFESAPSGAIEITDEQWEAHLARSHVLSLDAGGALVTTERSAATPEERLASWRAVAFVPRTTFCINCKRLGVLSPQDAILAAQGGWPETFAAALDALPAEIDRDEAQIVWAAVTDVYRSDPVLSAMQIFMGMTDAQVDALFGESPTSITQPAEDPAP